MPTTKSVKSQPETKVNIGDAAVKKATGRNWDEWFEVLDNARAAKMNHQQIVAVVSEQHGVRPWWQQMVTVGYEQARGLRQPHQKCDGDWSINASKTINVRIGRLFDSWKDESLRRKWLGARDDRELIVRKATRPKSLRITWCDGRTNVDVNLLAKGDSKSSVQVEHGKLSDAKEAARQKKFWAAALERLKRVLEE